jgi:DNA replication and repair protein RecF
MRLTHLSLTNFRNFVRLETQFPSGVTLLVGANAQGKTSLLEAVYLLTGASSPHASSERQMINLLALDQPTPFARLAAEVHRGSKPQRIEIRMLLEQSSGNAEPRLRKEVLLNGVKRRQRALAGVFNAVFFHPHDLRIIDGSPSERRRYIDATLSQADPIYAKTLAEYAKVLSQRNALLKQLQERNGDRNQLEFWDDKIAELSAALIRARFSALHELEALATVIHQQLTRQREVLRLEYLPAFNPLTGPREQPQLPLDSPLDWTSVGLEQIRQGMLAALKELRGEEIARGATVLGPHRDEIRFLANGIELRPYGSRGQHRTAMLATKLAEVEWLRERTGFWPTLLLDEVLAELDAERRQDLLRTVSEAKQALLTTSELAMFTQDFQQSATMWQITAGTLAPLTP